MEEGTFSAWLKQDGDPVLAGDLLFALDSDKVTQDVESLDAGTLHIPPDAPKPGDKVEVGQLLAYLLAAGEGIPAGGALAVKPEPPAQPISFPDPSLASVQANAQGIVGKPIVTPRARRVAGELGVNWADVPGTGRGGRIREADIRAAAAVQRPKGLSSTRQTTGERMLASQQKTAAVTLHTTADATSLVCLRRELKAVPTYNDMLVKLAAAALRLHPALNSRWDGETLAASPAVNIGIAVDTEAGLLVPVIRDAAALTLSEVSARSRDLTERARARRLSGDELRGGTFTITNLGSYRIDAFTPIINYPECAILGVGRILRQPVAVGDAIGLRDIVTLSLTFDHRALDGAPAARFLQTLTGLIESPVQALGLSAGAVPSGGFQRET
ncbi:MAG: 2-oxo acid dehydrogenase subunit E2, partial [Bryobacterales bacterium]|nr:2-oxo acid dehydrogenase subunit E2 [Bryobacterales bacterium]